MTNNDWKKEYITKGQAINAIVRNFSKIKQMPLVNGVEKYIKNLSTLKQELKTGHWINICDKDFHDYRTGNKLCFECSECHTHWTYKYNYCPNCGARMIEGSDTE